VTVVHRPTCTADAVEVLAELHARDEAALVVGGGTIVVPRLGRGELRADHIVDLWDAGLGRVERQPGVLRIGAQVTYQQLLDDPSVRDVVPLISLMCAGITGGVQLRSQGTLAGSACAARPFSDLPSVLTALGAQVRVRGVDGVRLVGYDDFVLDAERTALGPSDVVEALDVPIPDDGHHAGHRKVKTAEGSWPIVTVSALRTRRRVVVGVGGVLRRPVRLEAALDDFSGSTEAVIDRLAAVLGAPGAPAPWADVLAPAWYRRRVAPAVVRGVLEVLATGRHAHPKEERWHN
jgi:CO/xanthine dehydrogenase FAD-binding subunit